MKWAKICQPTVTSLVRHSVYRFSLCVTHRSNHGVDLTKAIEVISSHVFFPSLALFGGRRVWMTVNQLRIFSRSDVFLLLHDPPRIWLILCFAIHYHLSFSSLCVSVSFIWTCSLLLSTDQSRALAISCNYYLIKRWYPPSFFLSLL